jgi:GR25 family glycosyltransferase involved in LPS biosynthesis
VGRFDEGAAHFEHDYAQRYVAAGLRSAFFDGVFALHTGRLTSERGDAARPNAYALNGQTQFGDPARSLPALLGAVRGDGIAQRLGVKVINLERRPDRLASFRSRLKDVASAEFISRVERFAAIDGRTLALTPDIRHTFRGNDFGYRRSFIGCAQSHLALWKELAASAMPAFLIFEDDVTLCRDFEEQLAALCGELEAHHPAFDLVLLGCIDWQPRPEDGFEAAHRAVRLRPFEGARYLGGMFAYILSHRGAQRLLAIVERDGIQNGIDRFVHRKEAELELLVATPHLAQSALVPPASGRDSDIQNDFESLPDCHSDLIA